MKKNKNYKKKTIYTILLIVIAIMVVGFAVLSSSLNIFGGLGIIPGDLGWGVKWSNLEVNSESNATVNAAPTLANNDISVNFVVTLDQPGKFYEFTVDAVNTGTMDAMIDGVNTTIYNSEDEDVYPDYLNYSVEYAGGGEVLSGHLLRAGESVKYKVRIEFSNDISVEDLPTQEEQLRFEFGVTYIQADDTAFDPNNYYIYANNMLSTNDPRIGDNISIFDTYYTNYYDAMSESENNIFLRYYIENDIIKEISLGFEYNGDIYYVDSTPGDETYNSNREMLKSIFGESNCSDSNNCIVDGMKVYVNNNGGIFAVNSNKWRCGVSSNNGGARCRYV